ncbi:MAG: TlpA disulfide reductase family protein [Pseudomonadota bacterium]
MSDSSISRRHFLAGAAAVPFLGLLPTGAQSNTRGIVGAMAPELDAEFWLDAEGDSSEFSLMAQRGKWVYLKCWQSWCPGCHSHGFPALQKFSTAFHDNPDVVAVGIQTTFEGHQINTGDKVRETQQRYRLKIPMGHDPGSRNDDGYPNTMRAYRTGGTPWQVIIEPSGRVVYDGFRVNIDKVIEYIGQQLQSKAIG